jgi:hypothetical protein
VNNTTNALSIRLFLWFLQVWFKGLSGPKHSTDVMDDLVAHGIEYQDGSLALRAFALIVIALCSR